ncbi:MAG: hypothetical protein SF187_08485 [Deltaproteobacteria bacterium]|nr:hypothetical protein [Deltaproteobacteria bacterium]
MSVAHRLGWGGSVLLGVSITAAATVLGFAAIVYLPANHFMPLATPLPARHPLIRVTILVLRNVLGYALILLGMVMMLPLVPGPGLVFVLLGLSLIDFPGKRALQMRLLQRPAVSKFITSLRARYGRPPFIVD